MAAASVNVDIRTLDKVHRVLLVRSCSVLRNDEIVVKAVDMIEPVR